MVFLLEMLYRNEIILNKWIVGEAGEFEVGDDVRKND